MAQERTTKSPGFVIQSWRRLNDPQDGRAALLVSLGFLALESVLCSLIILKVPCELPMQCISTSPFDQPVMCKCSFTINRGWSITSCLPLWMHASGPAGRVTSSAFLCWSFWLSGLYLLQGFYLLQAQTDGFWCTVQIRKSTGKHTCHKLLGLFRERETIRNSRVGLAPSYIQLVTCTYLLHFSNSQMAMCPLHR
jgi:hypothetical protein